VAVEVFGVILVVDTTGFLLEIIEVVAGRVVVEDDVALIADDDMAAIVVDDVAPERGVVDVVTNDTFTAAVSAVVAAGSTTGRPRWSTKMKNRALAMRPIAPTFTKKEYSREGICSNIL
jgi:hypothetical protein